MFVFILEVWNVRGLDSKRTENDHQISRLGQCCDSTVMCSATVWMWYWERSKSAHSIIDSTVTQTEISKQNYMYYDSQMFLLVKYSDLTAICLAMIWLQVGLSG